jgi:hypothetical protein
MAVAESVCAGLAIRDASMVARGVPDRLRPVPAALLYLELAVGALAALAGLPLLPGARPAGQAPPARADIVRRATHSPAIVDDADESPVKRTRRDGGLPVYGQGTPLVQVIELPAHLWSRLASHLDGSIRTCCRPQQVDGQRGRLCAGLQR